ncbi:hydrogenase maturation protein HypF [Candidatus Kryptobacter tengchongensis]|nr:hydrogenase maturation protein HypF [Candidatus Kryptobacter tengchongensis]
MLKAKKIYIEGIVQGVGFRPFIFKLANEFNLKGYIYNDTNGVYIEVEGEENAIDEFIKAIPVKAPPLSLIEKIISEPTDVKGYSEFFIEKSKSGEEKFVLISPDVSTCNDCLNELFDPNDRRFRYPFINCTNCGPRFTIIIDVPYDRPKTTMSVFKMCDECEREYHDPSNRRFHAQPNACPVCGPRIKLLDRNLNEINCDDAIRETAKLLKDGFIVAIKGLGGYHLACNALDNGVVAELRKRKMRIEKPFAIMIPDVKWLDEICVYNETELKLLTSIQRPIVLMRKRKDCPIAYEVAPRNSYLGVMLPYTPLHYLILREVDIPLVMTSGNLTEEPIAYKDDDAFERLKNIADFFLIHNREIHIRCDDSVATVITGKPVMIRRSRGYVPYPVKIPFEAKEHILAVGGHLKNTFCFLKGNYAFLSHHIGDLENWATLKSLIEGVEHFKKLFDLNPKVLAYDMHPEYLSTKYALELDIPIKIPVQHHHAHIVSCMTENNLSEPVIGVAFDGTGFGIDGKIWGGEFFITELSKFERVAHFEYIPLPGGEISIKEPWRMAVSYLYHTFGNDLLNIEIPFIKDLTTEKINKVKILLQIIDRKINSPFTSAVGRLFDAVSALCYVRLTVNYEAQAAMEFQMLADENEKGFYDFEVIADSKPWKISFKPGLIQIVNDILNKVPISKISGKFHNTIANIICEISNRIRMETGLDKVVLSGGVFQNALLVEKAVLKLYELGFKVYTHSKVPPNDGGLSLGQAVIALFKSFHPLTI